MASVYETLTARKDEHLYIKRWNTVRIKIKAQERSMVQAEVKGRTALRGSNNRDELQEDQACILLVVLNTGV